MPHVSHHFEELEMDAISAVRQLEHTGNCPYCSSNKTVNEDWVSAIPEGELKMYSCPNCGLEVGVDKETVEEITDTDS